MFNTVDSAAAGSLAPDAGPRNLLRLVTGAAQSLVTWAKRRRQRRALSELDAHLLRDIGLAREDVERVCSQSFWMR
jgi:uncharacterized protein YjiS (DUF1127 family)